MPPKAAFKVKKVIAFQIIYLQQVKVVDKKKGRKTGTIEEEGASENIDDDTDLLNMDQNNLTGID